MLILIAGPECSGKTALARALAGYYSGQWLPEYAPEYLDGLGRHYAYEDIGRIAREHDARLKALVACTSRDQYIFLDSFLVNLKIWSLYRFGRVDTWIEERISTLDMDCVLLLRPNIPWEEGPYRENPGDRDQLFDLYEAQFAELNWPYRVVDALGEERLFQAIGFIGQEL